MKTILPGATIGVMGSGQLGRMFTNEAVREGYHVICYSPDKHSPAEGSGAVDFTGEYHSKRKLISFLKKIDALTFEFENIPETALKIISEYSAVHKLPVSPSPESILVSQKRHLEKTFFNNIGLKTAGFTHFASAADLKRRIAEISFPCILKTNSFGYDGKGQYRLNSLMELDKVIPSLKKGEFITEEIIGFDREISVIAARFAGGRMVIYPPSENIHVNGILDTSIHPARINDKTRARAIDAAALLAEKLDYTGIFGLEMFVKGHDLIMNEFAPRPHNSGHFTQNAAAISQFGLQLRTLCNIPVGDKISTGNCIMKNILGDTYHDEIRHAAEKLASPDFHLHLYGKKEARKGRKMGHWNFTGWDGKSDPAAVFK